MIKLNNNNILYYPLDIYLFICYNFLVIEIEKILKHLQQIKIKMCLERKMYYV